MSYCIYGAQVLSQENFKNQDLLIENGRIVNDLRHEPCMVDASGCWILPGIIDLHGDAFERAMTPRPGVDFPVAQGLAENDAALIACGITSFFYAITDGFEPGLRSRATVRRLLHQLEDLAPRLRCRSLVHIRHETANVEAPEELRNWMQQGRIHLLSLNDHLPNLDDAERLQRYRRGLTRRVSMDDEAMSAFLHGLQAQYAQGLQIVDQLCAWAAQYGLPLAAHDDANAADVTCSQQRQVTINEFPMSLEAAHAARAAGQTVVLGAPNLVRGSSHVNGLSVREAIAAGACDALCSDYSYPALLRAPFLIAELGLLSFERAWDLVSSQPAAAAGLTDLGSLAPGKQADLLIMDAFDGSPLSLRGTMVAGRWALQRDLKCQTPQGVTS